MSAIKDAVKAANKLAGESRSLDTAVTDIGDMLKSLKTDLESEVTSKLVTRDSGVSHSADTDWRRLGVSVARLFFCDAYVQNDVVDGKAVKKLRFVGRPHLVKIADDSFNFLTKSIREATHGQGIKNNAERYLALQKTIASTVIDLAKLKSSIVVDNDNAPLRDVYATEEVAMTEHFIAKGIFPLARVIDRTSAPE